MFSSRSGDKLNYYSGETTIWALRHNLPGYGIGHDVSSSPHGEYPHLVFAGSLDFHRGDLATETSSIASSGSVYGRPDELYEKMANALFKSPRFMTLPDLASLAPEADPEKKLQLLRAQIYLGFARLGSLPPVDKLKTHPDFIDDIIFAENGEEISKKFKEIAEAATPEIKIAMDFIERAMKELKRLHETQPEILDKQDKTVIAILGPALMAFEITTEKTAPRKL